MLHDDLLAAIPDLRPALNADGELEAVMVIDGRDDDIRLTVPEAADDTAIALVVTNHDHTQLQAAPRRTRLARIAEILAIARTS